MSTAPPGEADDDTPLPRWWSTQPLGLWWLLPLGLGGALWVLLDGRLRLFGYAVGATLAAAALLRLVLPRDRVGGLMVRSRAWDVITLLALAGAIVTVSAILVIR